MFKNIFHCKAHLYASFTHIMLITLFKSISHCKAHPYMLFVHAMHGGGVVRNICCCKAHLYVSLYGGV
jgi:hypothetical protein